MREFLRFEKTFEMLSRYSAGAKSFNSFHQNIGVVMDKFLELIAEEILKDTQTRRVDQLVLPTAHRPKSIGAFLIRK